MMPVESILGVIAQYGVGGVFVVLWWLERNERRDAQNANAEMFERTVTALVQNNETIRTVKEIFKVGKTE